MIKVIGIGILAVTLMVLLMFLASATTVEVAQSVLGCKIELKAGISGCSYVFDKDISFIAARAVSFYILSSGILMILLPPVWAFWIFIWVVVKSISSLKLKIEAKK